jgi:membrane protein implicated in regulation of membrane protease activity
MRRIWLTVGFVALWAVVVVVAGAGIAALRLFAGAYADVLLLVILACVLGYFAWDYAGELTRNQSEDSRG